MSSLQQKMLIFFVLLTYAKNTKKWHISDKNVRRIKFVFQLQSRQTREAYGEPLLKNQ
jgi:hypothetical protein